ncbi:LLM class flavin-dependent oxidoreductase [Chryseomicrobium sp. FSL W7-1435]|uniref:LLM class flavin-dependent oxidoreductase n=1 Tax=Chryseomicrobium sp. FSL W7-1435 TaxID=2921704 RepID=UPI00315AFC75
MTKLSFLDLASVRINETPTDSFQQSKQLVQQAEKLGYHRYWVAEHHNMQGVASSATSVLIGYLAGHTSTIRVGAGGIMLPNHAPYIIAEQFGTLDAMYPGRIDLGLGRAPGTDMMTARALRRDHQGADDFPELVNELLHYMSPVDEERLPAVMAVPGADANVPVWLLGSSTYSARLAAQLGLPFAFASHFAPDQLMQALELYHRNFRPSSYLQEPYAMAAVNIVAAETDEEAEGLSTTLIQQFLSIIRGHKHKMRPPVAMEELDWSMSEQMMVERTVSARIVGSEATVREQLQAFVEKTRVQEVMVSTPIYDVQKRLKSMEIAMRASK